MQTGAKEVFPPMDCCFEVLNWKEEEGSEMMAEKRFRVKRGLLFLICEIRCVCADGTSPLEREYMVPGREAQLHASERVGWDLMHSKGKVGVSRVQRGQAEEWVQRQVGCGLGY